MIVLKNKYTRVPLLVRTDNEVLRYWYKGTRVIRTFKDVQIIFIRIGNRRWGEGLVIGNITITIP